MRTRLFLVCKRIFQAFLSQDRLKRLFLAWNGISQPPAVIPLAKYVSRSEVLEFLDISHNRFVLIQVSLESMTGLISSVFF